MKYLLPFFFLIFSSIVLSQPEIGLSGIEIQVDQDYFADYLRPESNADTDKYYDDNYTVALRVGIYGEYANSYYLGLPWVRERIDYVLDNILYRRDFRQKSESHNFTFTVNGYGPRHINADHPGYALDVSEGYSLEDERPFSSFTGFRSSRRLTGTKRFVHSARLYQMGVNTSFAFGLGGVGLARGIDNLLGFQRPDADLWKRDESAPYPTGQVLKNVFPIFLYSVSSEIAVLSPIRKVVLQVRPELNLGYYTDVALGIDFGKVMSVEGVIDNLSYTDTNNPSSATVNDQDMGFSLVGGITVRGVLYNYHLNGLYGKSKGNYVTFADTRKFVYEGYIGVKLQILQRVDITYSVNYRSQEFKAPLRYGYRWGTIGIKYLMGPAGVGCYD